MFGNVLAATMRNLIRNRLYAAISIGGLAIGMAAAILTGLYVRDELSFDSFMPGHNKAYVVVWELDQPGAAPIVEDWSQYFLAKAMKLDFKEVQASARLNLFSPPTGVRVGNVEGLETIGWSDPDLFAILRAPTVAGNPVATLHRPDGVVITRAMARKYFGQDAPIGRLLQLNRQVSLRVGAVIQDPPPTSDLVFQIFASGLNAASPLKQYDQLTDTRGTFWVTSRTYLRLPNAAAAAHLNATMPAFFKRHLANPDGSTVQNLKGSFKLIPIGDLHLYPLKGTSLVNNEGLGSRGALLALSVIAALVLCTGLVNFINLMSGRAARRAVEVGVRKAAGARRRDLVLQFMGEALLYTLIALVLAVALAELARPLAKGLVGRDLASDLWRDPLALGGCVALTVVLGLLTGAYPAFVQSSFRPAVVLKGVLPQTTGSAAIRSVLTTLQFAVLIGLILAIIVIAKQTHYALNEAFHIDGSTMLTVDVTPTPQLPGAPPQQHPMPCRDSFPDRVRAIPGVAGAACSGSGALEVGDNSWDIEGPTGPIAMDAGLVDHGFFELYGLKPLAGRFFSSAHPEDEIPIGPGPLKAKTVVINENAARALGYRRPELAVGQFLRPQGGIGPIQIIGVAPDMTFDLTHPGKHPATYVDMPGRLDTLTVKLTGRDVPATLKAIDAAWRATGSARPARRRFVSDYLQQIYLATIQQGRLLDVLCAVAVLLAGLGLFGLASFTAERRVKEIGVRKAMGASTVDVAQLLLWSFSQPVLWANLIAWPLGWWALSQWLEGFSRHIDLEPWMFLAAGAAALVMALATVLSHTLRVASAKPVGALRYE